MLKQYLEVGKIVGTHGVRGEMRVECWANSPDFLRKFKKLYLDEGQKALSVTCRPHKNIALVTAKGVDSIEAADALRGKVFDLYGIVAGLAFVFRSRGDWSAEEEIVRWGLTVFSGIRNGGVTGYLDKVEAVLRLLLADARLESGRREEARTSVGEAAALAAAFDAAPDHGIADLRFVPGPADSSVHDVLGGTAAESTAFLLERLDHPELSYLWREATKGSAGASGENEGVDR